jgi:hypothetical protein
MVTPACPPMCQSNGQTRAGMLPHWLASLFAGFMVHLEQSLRACTYRRGQSFYVRLSHQHKAVTPTTIRGFA